MGTEDKGLPGQGKCCDDSKPKETFRESRLDTPVSPLGEKASYVSKGRMGSSEHDEKLTVHRAADEG